MPITQAAKCHDCVHPIWKDAVGQWHHQGIDRYRQGILVLRHQARPMKRVASLGAISLVNDPAGGTLSLASPQAEEGSLSHPSSEED